MNIALWIVQGLLAGLFVMVGFMKVRQSKDALKEKGGGRMNWEPLRAKIAKQGMRNSNVLAIAPTATISNITNTSPCIEPTYKNLYVKSNLSGEFVVLNPFLV